MFLNSKRLRCDVSDIQTCEVCTEKPIFFTDKKLFEHIQRCHSKKQTYQEMVAAQGLRELEKSKDILTKQLADIKTEYRQLYKSGMAKRHTVELVQKQINSLKKKISKNEEEITKIKSSLQTKEEENIIQNDPQQVMAAFKCKMDKEYACLLDSLTSKVSVPELLSEDGDTESLRSENVDSNTFRRLTRERLSKLEVDVKQMKYEFSQKEKKKENDAQSFQVITGKCQTLEDKLKSKTTELESSHECIEKMKAILEDNEKEVSLVRQLCENYKESTQAHSTTKASLEEKLTETNRVKEKLKQNNAELTQDLHKAISSLGKAEHFIKRVTEEQERAETEKQHNERRIQELLKQAEDAKKEVTVGKETDDSKIKILQQQLAKINEELKTKTTLVAELEDKLTIIESSLNEDIKLLTIEKEELLGIIREMKAERTANDKDESKLVNLQQEHNLLIKRNEEITTQLEAANELKTKLEETIEEQKNSKVQVLHDEKALNDKKLNQVMFERDRLQRKLSDVEQEHEKCRKKERELKVSYEQSIQSMRMQMEQLIAEETGRSIFLENQLKEKEKFFQEASSNMKDEIESREEQINTLNEDLKDTGDLQQRSQEQIDQLEAEIACLQNKIKNYNQLEEERSYEVLRKSENEKQQLVAAFKDDKTELTNQISQLELQLSKEKTSVKMANERVLEIESTLVEVEEQHNDFLQKVKKSFEKEQIGFQEKKNKELEEELECLNDNHQKELDSLKQEYDEEISKFKNKISIKEDFLQMQREQFEKMKVEQELMVNELKEEYEDNSRKERSKYETQLEEEKVLNQQLVDKLNNKIKELQAEGEEIDNSRGEVDSMKLELIRQKEDEKFNKEEIKRLKEKLEGEMNNANMKLEIKATQDKVTELSNALHQAQQQYNDSIVDNDEVCQRLRSCKSDLNVSQIQIEDLKLKLEGAERASSEEHQRKSNAENELDETKTALAKHISEIENLLKGRKELENELQDFKQSSESLKADQNKLSNQLKVQITENKQLMEKLSKAKEELTKFKKENQQPETTSLGKISAKEAIKDENEAAYSSSFDEASSPTTKSISFGTASSFTSNEFNTHSKEASKRHKQSSAKSNDEEEITTEETQDEISLPIDDPMRTNVDEKHSVVSDDEFGTSLTRKQTLTNFQEDATKSEISIPKRDWGEKFIKGIDQSIDEEFGIEFDESIASVEEEPSKVPATSNSMNINTNSSSGSDTEQKLSTTNLSDSPNKNKKITKKKKNKSLKKKKSQESANTVSSLPPLKGGLPPLKTRPLLDDLPPLKGAPKRPTQTQQQPPAFEPTRKPLASQEKKRSLSSTPENAMECQPSEKSSKISFTALKSQRNSMLGDLPPLFGVKPSTDDMHGENSDEEDEDNETMGDIDALLQGLDDIDAKKSNKSKQ